MVIIQAHLIIYLFSIFSSLLTLAVCDCIGHASEPEMFPISMPQRSLEEKKGPERKYRCHSTADNHFILTCNMLDAEITATSK